MGKCIELPNSVRITLSFAFIHIIIDNLHVTFIPSIWLTMNRKTHAGNRHELVIQCVGHLRSLGL